MKAIWVLSVLSVASALSKHYHPLSQEYIDHLNQQKLTWKAGKNFGDDVSLDYIKSLLGTRKSQKRILQTRVSDDDNYTEIPSSFDAREYWSKCEIIKEIRDQSSCGSCWAVATVSAISDRVCISSNGERQVPISASDLLSCCGFLCGLGCNGGFPDNAWKYWVDSGIVTGGEYNSSIGCKPYPFPSCEHHVEGDKVPCSSLDFSTPRCTRKCDNDLVYNQEKSYGKASYYVASDVRSIQLEILKNGPVEAAFSVYYDFVNYKSGVYQHYSGEYAGGHAVKVLGWGEEDGVPYWLVANSWNTDWGDNGLFKIIRGKNEGGFESEITAGIPEL